MLLQPGTSVKSAKVPAQAKSATATPARAKGGKKAAKAKPAASGAPRPHKTTASVAKDIPGLKKRFLAGALEGSDWDDVVALLDAAEDRRQKNKLKQRNWRGQK